MANTGLVKLLDAHSRTRRLLNAPKHHKPIPWKRSMLSCSPDLTWDSLCRHYEKLLIATAARDVRLITCYIGRQANSGCRVASEYSQRQGS